jgi:hypothetical protein
VGSSSSDGIDAVDDLPFGVMGAGRYLVEVQRKCLADGDYVDARGRAATGNNGARFLF